MAEVQYDPIEVQTENGLVFLESSSGIVLTLTRDAAVRTADALLAAAALAKVEQPSS